MRVEGGRKESNLRRAAAGISAAAAGGAQVVVLPEAMPLGWTHPSARDEAERVPEGETFALLSKLASQHRIYICSGIVERDGRQLFNSALLVGPDGELLLCHRKIHELDIARDLYSRGERLAVVQTPLAAFGLMICADAFAPGQSIARALALMGANVILSPCAWAVPADHDNEKDPYGQLWLDNYCPVARDFGIWIAGASNVGLIEAGPWKGRKCIGCSLVVNPHGAPVTRGPYGEHAEAILYADVTLL